MQAAGVHDNRFILNWVWVEPTQSHFDWGSSDRFIGELASRGIRALPSVWGNPELGGGRRRYAPDRRDRCPAAVAEPAQGAGGAVRARR